MALPQKVGDDGWTGSVQGAVATWSTHRSHESLGMSHADHDQVATAPCTDPIQVKILILETKSLRDMWVGSRIR